MDKIERGNPLTQSADIVKENLEILKQLFPTIVKEGKIDVDELKALIDDDVETSEEYYRFTWAGKSEARREANKPSTGTLRPNKADSKNWDTTGNIFIEGDNLEVMKLMQKSYAGKIKVTYFDPPYNTGKDFVYKDNYNDNLTNYLELSKQIDEEGHKLSTNTETDGRYHSNWLNMLYPRLKLARNLSSDDGVIFISIDDNEVDNLKKLCNEIFGEENFVGCLKWKRKKQPSYLHGHIASVMEYILIYGKNKSKLEKLSLEKRSDSNTRIDNATNKLSERFIKKGVRVKLSSNISLIKAGIYKNKTMSTEYMSDVIIDNGRTVNDFYVKAHFRNEQSVITNFIDEDVIFITKNYGFRRDLLQEELEKRKSITDLLLDWGDNQDSDKEMNDLFPEGKPFEYPKPSKLISNLIGSVNSENQIIFDFFGGSGTTAQAVLELNKEDLGNRKFILVQLPEKCNEQSEAFKANYENIADVSIARIIRVVEKIENEKKSAILENEILSNRIKESKAKIEEIKINNREINFGDVETIEIKKILESIEISTNKIIQNEELINNINSCDLGFKAFKLDSSNINSWDGSVENFEVNLFNAQNNIKDDRTEEDVLFEILLKYGLDLTVPIQEKAVGKCKVYSIGAGVLFISLSDNITTEVAKAIGEWKKELEPATCRVLFKDNGFIDDVAKTNSVQILRQYGIEECNSI